MPGVTTSLGRPLPHGRRAPVCHRLRECSSGSGSIAAHRVGACQKPAMRRGVEQVWAADAEAAQSGTPEHDVDRSTTRNKMQEVLPLACPPPDAGSSPQRDTEVGAHELPPVYEDFPAWLGGMTPEGRWAVEPPVSVQAAASSSANSSGVSDRPAAATFSSR